MFNNPNFFPYQSIQPKASLFRSLKALNFGEILNGTQKTLNVINQAIPIFHQIKPLWNNTKTIFRIANAINEDGHKKEPQYQTQNNHNNNKNYQINNQSQNTVKNIQNNSEKNIKYNEPVFFI